MRGWNIALLLTLVSCTDQPAPTPSHPRATPEAAISAYQSEKSDFQVQELVTGLQHPWGLAFLPDGSLLVTERSGLLRRIGADRSVSAPITGLPDIFVDGQAGLLDVAVSPRFDEDALVYLSFAQANLRGNKAGTAVARGRLSGGALEDVQVIYSQEPKLSSGTH
ncbi:MAG: PQQ-dependent sugar dehydrogenase, partial [Proteobacteria bacterium]